MIFRYARLLAAVWLALQCCGLQCTSAPAAAPAPMPQAASPVAPPPELPAELARLLADYDQYFRAQMQATQTPGAAVAIVVDTQLVWLRGYGLRQLGVPDSVDAHTVFRIGSLSKGFAGVLTGILVQEGLLRWEEPVQKHFPEFTLRDRKQAARIQLWHLLSHTTGLPYHAYTNLIEEGYDIRRIITQYFPKAPVSGREGVFFSYQNAAFCAIEEVVAKATGRSYATLIREKIFQPAGMHHASTDFSSIQNSPNRALPHFWTGQQWRPDNISPLYYNSLAAGGVNASISDMGAWLRLLLGQRPQAVQESTLDRVFRPVVKTGKERRIMPHWIDRDAAAYAMGWRVLQHGADTLLYHGGYVNGFRGEIALNRRDKVGICVLFNGSSELANHCIEAFFERWEQ